MTVNPMSRSEDWIDRFEGLKRLPEDIRADLMNGSQIVKVPGGTQLFAPGQSPGNLILLLEGSIRVQQRSETGREVFLYRVHAGESCVLTSVCMQAFEEYSIDGIAETEVTTVVIPRTTFDELVARSRIFREFVFAAYSRRITDLFTLINNIVFQKMDVRLASRLLELADNSDTVHVTHAFLASELGTAREVISRTLAEFQRRGWIEQSRGRVDLVGREGLTRLVRSTGT